MIGWAPWAVAAICAAVAGVSCVGMERAERRAADAKAQWAEEKAQIEHNASEDMRKAIDAHNETAKQLEVIHAESQKQRAIAAEYAASAVVAGSNAARAERRLRDSAATAALAASAVLGKAGTTAECQTQAKTVLVQSDVLGRLTTIAGRLRERVIEGSGSADDNYEAAVECSRRYEAIR